MDQYRQAYQEEARELLAELESALLALDQDRENRELVGRAFRALHTIKGSGAMFGFDDIAAFAHDLETAFDQLRNGQLAATTSLINLTLAACDQIRSMLQPDEPGSAVRARSASMLAELTQLTAPPSASTETARPWGIHFRPKPDILLNGTNPILLLRELRGLGRLEVAADTSALPPLAELDPERCYVAWDMVLTTAVPLEAIRDVFLFVEGDCELTIEPLPDRPKPGQPAEPQHPARPVAENATTSVAAASSVRVAAHKLDEFVNLVGELVTVQARLGELAARRADPEIQAVSEEIERLTTELRENSMSIRMLPLRTTFERFRRLVHDLGSELGKDVQLVIEGAETELDKTVIEQLNDPLVHLIRNSMDHGIEPTEARRAAGKPIPATIHLSATHSGAHVLIRVTDDGRGLDPEAIRARALAQGLVEADARLSDCDLASLILAPGFSTARRVTDVSGRGVGMDVVRRSIEALRGSMEISSRPGAGMAVTLRLPLTLAIIDGLLVRVGQSHFVLPLANSLECVELTGQDIAEAHGNHIANVRGELIPYVRLSEYFQMPVDRREREQIMVVETEHGHFGFVVDQVLGDHQTVIKNLGRLYRNVQVVSGATILGNGSVALILDPHRLVQSVLQSDSKLSNRFVHEEKPTHGK